MVKPILSVAAISLASITAAHATDESIDARMVVKENIKTEFSSSTKHFVSAVPRDGSLKARALNNAGASKYRGHHVKPLSDDSLGEYLEFMAGTCDIQTMEYTIRAVFFKGMKNFRVVD